MLVLDTNVYVDMFADRELSRRVASRAAEMGETLLVSSVVAAELMAGAVTERDRRVVDRLVTEAATPHRLLVPSHEDWVRAGRALVDLGGDAVTTRRSFWNDLLIAASCARVGALLMTRNADDFVRIRRTIPVDLVSRPA